MSKRRRQYVYRNTCVEIEPGRFVRDGWERELWFERDSLRRATEGKMKVKSDVPPLKKARVYGPTPLTPDEIPTVKGFYRLIGTEPLPTGRSFKVIARCSGHWCQVFSAGSRERAFAVGEWIKKARPTFACNVCANAERAAARRAAKATLQ